MKLSLSSLLAVIQAASSVFTAIALLQNGDEAEQQFSISIHGDRYDCVFSAKKVRSQGR